METTHVGFCEAEQKKGGLLAGDMGLGRVFQRWEMVMHVSEPEGTSQ